MSWIKLDDQIAHHPKVASAGVSTWLWVASIGFARKYLTDGFIPEGCIASLSAGIDKPRSHMQRLVKAKLMDKVDGGYQIHDYLHFNDSAEQVRARREADRVRKDNERTSHGQEPEKSRSPEPVLARARASSTTTTTIPKEKEQIPVVATNGNGQRPGSGPSLIAIEAAKKIEAETKERKAKRHVRFR